VRLGIVLLAVGALCGALFLLARDDGRSPRESPPERPPPQAEPEPIAAVRGLEVRDGVARAPDFPDPADAEAAPAAAGACLLIGRVVDAATRNPLPDVALVVERRDGEKAWACRRSAANGRFRIIVPKEAIAVAAEAPLRLVATARPGETGQRPIASVEPGVRDLGAVLVRATTELEGRVLDRAGRPVPGIGLAVFRYGELLPLPDAAAQQKTDERGDFRFETIARGIYGFFARGNEGRLFFHAPVVVPVSDRVVVREIETKPLDLTVVNTAGELQNVALVQAFPVTPARGTDPFSIAHFLDPPASTTKEGRARIEHLPLGRYTLFCTLADGTPFEYDHHHQGASHRHLLVGSTPTYYARLVEFDGQRDPPPLANAQVSCEVQGTCGVPGANRRARFKTRTDGDGLVAIRRIGSKSFVVRFDAPKELRTGSLTVDARRHLEGDGRMTVLMRARDADPTVPTLQRAAAGATNAPRRARVVTAEGVPVERALVYVRAGVRLPTGRDGLADLGGAPNAAHAQLYRPDLASGDPVSLKFGNAAQVELTWRDGRAVELRLRDVEAGFPIDHARIHPHPLRWERVASGTYRGLWDAASAETSEIRIVAKGYETATVAAPEAGGSDPFVREIDLLVPSEPERVALDVTVLHKTRPVSTAVVTGRCLDHAKDGRWEFAAITSFDGRVWLANLAAGRWRLEAETGKFHGTLTTPLMKGINRISLAAETERARRGTVTDGGKRRIAGAVIRPAVLSAKWYERYRLSAAAAVATRTDARGEFFLSDALARYPLLEVTARGFAPLQFGQKMRLLRLERLGAIDVSVQWADGASDPIPKGLVLRAVHRPHRVRARQVYYSSGQRYRRDETVHEGRLRIEGVPAGHYDIYVKAGAAWTSTSMRVRAGKAAQSPTITLKRGGYIEGKVIRDAKPVAGVVVFLRGKGPRSARTDRDGRFAFQGIAPGRYSLSHPLQIEVNRRALREIHVKDGWAGKFAVEIR